MPRPVKWRKIENLPEYRMFKPANIPAFELEENILKVEELEAIRLRDLEGLNQTACAEKMKISRQTFQRIYNKAKKKVADSLINGKAIKVKGGNYTQNICTLVCEECNHKWKKRIEDIERKGKDKILCPECGEHDILCDTSNIKGYCGERCRERKGCKY
ncbi:MAG: DUF134 domain-containing protein [Firmicutes bacterium]|nr:DUF134 domain-containing protein [Bacillota bacterium]MTI68654.1 DUF134 domain-containing protein [Bacillota bacterium]